MERDRLSERGRCESCLFIKKMCDFLRVHGISGFACSYYFSTTHAYAACEVLRRLGVKFRLDCSPHFHTKVIIGRNEI